MHGLSGTRGICGTLHINNNDINAIRFNIDHWYKRIQSKQTNTQHRKRTEQMKKIPIPNPEPTTNAPMPMLILFRYFIAPFNLAKFSLEYFSSFDLIHLHKILLLSSRIQIFVWSLFKVKNYFFCCIPSDFKRKKTLIWFIGLDQVRFG